MEGTGTLVLSVGLIIFLAHFFSSIFEKTKMPDVLPLIFIGILFSLFGYKPEVFGLSGSILSSIALALILFQGGSHLSFDILKKGINKVTILAHSQGCLVALEYANKFPKKLKKIIFVAGSHKIPVNKKLLNLAESGDMESLNLMMKWGYGYSKQFIGGNPLQKILNSAREVREVLAIDLKACNNYTNGINVAKKIKCPTLLILGELDKMIKLETGKEFSNLITNSKIHIIKNCGHMIILENAFEMREKVAEFLKK